MAGSVQALEDGSGGWGQAQGRRHEAEKRVGERWECSACPPVMEGGRPGAGKLDALLGLGRRNMTSQCRLLSIKGCDSTHGPEKMLQPLLAGQMKVGKGTQVLLFRGCWDKCSGEKL